MLILVGILKLEFAYFSIANNPANISSDANSNFSVPNKQSFMYKYIMK